MPREGRGVPAIRQRRGVTIPEQNTLFQSPAVANGVGLFETMLVARGRVVHLEAHYDRLDASALALGFPPVARDRFHELVENAAASVGDAESALRCVYAAIGRDLDDAGNWILDVSAGPVSPTTLARRSGTSAITLEPSLRRALPQHKLTSYAACVIGLRRARAAGASEGFFVDGSGRVLEGTATNVFAIAGDSLVTAPADGAILPGTVRSWTLAAARALHIPVVERAPTVDALRKGAFVTGSLTTLAPLEELDGARCASPGPIFERLSRLYRDEVW
jgi:branched-subunit amino acid aminotransferase/4-amino-4-deoxychorismate lyase